MNTLVKLLGLAALVGVAPVAAAPVADAPSSNQPKSFLKELGNSTWIIGNEIWNVTQNRQYANQLWYKGIDRVGEAVGHYVSYSTLKSTSLITFQHP
jgi:rhamnogalacturonan endolyase